METVFFGEDPAAVEPRPSYVGPVPDDLAVLLWGDEEALLAELKDVLEDSITETDLGPVHDTANLRPNRLIERICGMRLRRAYYQKYIDAGGVAIMGDGHLEDRYFYATREVVLEMTSKRPELRKLLSPSYDDRVNLTGKELVPTRKFRIILFHPFRSTQAIPEVYPNHLETIGTCSLDKCYVSVQIYKGALDTSVFVHEFAHALHFAINLFDATFEEELIAAYEVAKNNDDSYWGSFHGGQNSAESHAGEYWAFSVTRWFMRFSLPTGLGEYHHDQFREKDPMMYALLQEWFDFKYLGYIESKVYE